MKTHDPYGPMLVELRAINDVEDDDVYYRSLRQLQPYVTNLREQYRKCPSNVDFSCPYTRAAYLLAYYPHYIEPIYWTLFQLKGRGIENFLNQASLRVCFIGAGPAPEALGLAMFLQEYCPNTSLITGYLMDKYVDGWRQGQELTRYHLSPHYWSKGKLVFRSIEFDFLDEACLKNPIIDRAIRHAHLFIMQNCLNDQMGNPKSAYEMVLRIFRLAPVRSLLIICDLNFDPVRDLIRSIEKGIKSENIGKVILPVQQQATEIRSQVETPAVINENLLTGDPTKRLIARTTTNYYSSIFQRTE